MSFKKILAAVASSALAFSAVAASAMGISAMSSKAFAEDEPPVETYVSSGSGDVATSPDEYRAGLSFQTAEWMYRDSLDQKEIEGFFDDDEKPDFDTEFVDTVITGDGTYTVGLRRLPENTVPWHTLCLISNIPYSDNISVEVIAVDGDATLNPENKPCFENDRKNFKANFINEWNDGVKDTPVITLNEPVTDISITFTISGLNADEGEPPTDDEEIKVPVGTYHAGLIFQTGEWMYRDYLDDDEIQGDAVGENDAEFVDTVITGDGTYTVELKNLPENSVPWHSLCLLTDIPYSKSLRFEVIAVEGDATLNPENKPSIEDSKGNLRVNFINEWNEEVNKTPVITLGEQVTNISVTFTIEGFAETVPDETTPGEGSVPVGTYHAGLIFQTGEWIYRDTLDQTELGNLEENEDANIEVEFVDTVITGDGTYTVGLKNLPQNTIPWHSLCLLTDIPYGENLRFEVIAVEGDATLNPDNKPSIENRRGVFSANFINEWNYDVKDTPVITLGEQVTNISIIFTIEGFEEIVPDETKPEAPAEPTIVEGSANGEAEVEENAAVKIEVSELGVTIEAEAGSFGEAVSKIVAEVETKLADSSDTEKAAIIAAAIEGIANADESVSINDIISIVLKDQNGDTIQPAEGATVKVTLPYDGKSNYVAYIGDGTVEFIKLTIDGNFAFFIASHFSDYYLVNLSDDAVKAVESEEGNNNTTAEETKNPANDDGNKPTGIVIAIVPAVASAVGVIISKKRK